MIITGDIEKFSDSAKDVGLKFKNFDGGTSGKFRAHMLRFLFSTSELSGAGGTVMQKYDGLFTRSNFSDVYLPTVLSILRDSKEPKMRSLYLEVSKNLGVASADAISIRLLREEVLNDINYLLLLQILRRGLYDGRKMGGLFDLNQLLLPVLLENSEMIYTIDGSLVIDLGQDSVFSDGDVKAHGFLSYNPVFVQDFSRRIFKISGDEVISLFSFYSASSLDILLLLISTIEFSFAKNPQPQKNSEIISSDEKFNTDGNFVPSRRLPYDYRYRFIVQNSALSRFKGEDSINHFKPDIVTYLDRRVTRQNNRLAPSERDKISSTKPDVIYGLVKRTLLKLTSLDAMSRTVVANLDDQVIEVIENSVNVDTTRIGSTHTGRSVKQSLRDDTLTAPLFLRFTI